MAYNRCVCAQARPYGEARWVGAYRDIRVQQWTNESRFVVEFGDLTLCIRAAQKSRF